MKFYKLAEFAKGIPDKKWFEQLPPAEDDEWTLNVQHHKSKRAPEHDDLRLNPKDSDKAYSWALPEGLPKPGEKRLAVEQPIHTSHYMGFSGNIPEGEYGAGNVKSTFLDKAHILSSKPDKLLFNTYKGSDADRFMLKKWKDKNWFLYNYSHTKDKDVLPDYKKSYKHIDIKKLRTDYDDEVFAPKLDGAHNLVRIRPNKRIDVYSYRNSKKSDKKIDHSYRTDLYKRTGPEDLKETIIRSELYIPGERGNVVAGLLNKNVWDSRREQSQKNKKLKSAIIDVVKYDGKNVEDLPYSEKLEMMKEVSRRIPDLEMPPLYETREQKEWLKKQIEAKDNPLTEEGIVIYKKNESTPLKSKQRDDFDVVITGTYPPSEGSKYENTHVGGITAKIDGEGPEIRIGSGLSDEDRRQLKVNPQEFVGKWAVVEAQHQHDSGMLQAPIYKGLRPEKFPKSIKQAQYRPLIKHANARVLNWADKIERVYGHN